MPRQRFLAALLLIGLSAPQAGAQTSASRQGLTLIDGPEELAAYVTRTTGMWTGPVGTYARTPVHDPSDLTCKSVVPNPTFRGAARSSESVSSDPPVLRVRVSTEQGEPLFGANVTVEHQAPGARGGISVGTDERGRTEAILPGGFIAPPSSVLVRVRSFGYYDRRFHLQLAAGDSVDIDFILCRQPRHFDVWGTYPRSSLLRAVAGSGTTGETTHQRGRRLLLLRGNRLWSLDVGGTGIRLVDSIDAAPPGRTAPVMRYHALLVDGERVVVMGAEPFGGATEVNVFRIDRAGRLSFSSSQLLSAAGGQALRVIGAQIARGRLIVFGLTPVFPTLGEPLGAVPLLRSWLHDSTWSTVLQAATMRFYRADRDPGVDRSLAFHSLVSCAVEHTLSDCDVSTVVAPAAHRAVLSREAAFLWVQPSHGQADRAGMTGVLYRMSFDGAPPVAIASHGSPADGEQFAMESNDTVNVLLSAPTALLRIPVASMGDGSTSARAEDYRALPQIDPRALRHRFIGSQLVIGATRSASTQADILIVPIRGGAIRHLALPHPIDDIGAMEGDALVAGVERPSLRLTGIRVDGQPAVNQQIRLPAAWDNMSWLHGVQYDATGRRSGIVSVMASRWVTDMHGERQAREITYVQDDGATFREIGSLRSGIAVATRTDCPVACYDDPSWDRPIYVGKRVFAIFGTGLVEGRLEEERGRIVERDRVAFRY